MTRGATKAQGLSFTAWRRLASNYERKLDELRGDSGDARPTGAQGFSRAKDNEKRYVVDLEKAIGLATQMAGGPSGFSFSPRVRAVLAAYLPNGIQLCLNVDAFAEHLESLPEWADKKYQGSGGQGTGIEGSLRDFLGRKI